MRVKVDIDIFRHKEYLAVIPSLMIGRRGFAIEFLLWSFEMTFNGN